MPNGGEGDDDEVEDGDAAPHEGDVVVLDGGAVVVPPVRVREHGASAAPEGARPAQAPLDADQAPEPVLENIKRGK